MMLHVREYDIYYQIFMKQEHKLEDMKRSISEVYERSTKTTIPSHMCSFIMEMKCEDIKGNAIEAVPNIKYTFR